MPDVVRVIWVRPLKSLCLGVEFLVRSTRLGNWHTAVGIICETGGKISFIIQGKKKMSDRPFLLCSFSVC